MINTVQIENGHVALCMAVEKSLENESEKQSQVRKAPKKQRDTRHSKHGQQEEIKTKEIKKTHTNNRANQYASSSSTSPSSSLVSAVSELPVTASETEGSGDAEKPGGGDTILCDLDLEEEGATGFDRFSSCSSCPCCCCSPGALSAGNGIVEGRNKQQQYRSPRARLRNILIRSTRP